MKISQMQNVGTSFSSMGGRETRGGIAGERGGGSGRGGLVEEEEEVEEGGKVSKEGTTQIWFLFQTTRWWPSPIPGESLSVIFNSLLFLK